MTFYHAITGWLTVLVLAKATSTVLIQPSVGHKGLELDQIELSSDARLASLWLAMHRHNPKNPSPLHASGNQGLRLQSQIISGTWNTGYQQAKSCMPFVRRYRCKTGQGAMSKQVF